jgi:phosphoribosylamine---glycine ligase
MSLVTPTRILIVGSGGREHALAWKLAGEPGVNEVIVAPGSDGIAAEPRVRCAPGVDPLEPAEVVAIAHAESVELAVIGPEAPLAAGVADALIAAGIPTFGPTAAAARIEASKAFCHDIARRPVSGWLGPLRSRPSAGGAAFARSWARDGHGVVVKADGLAAGKGVTVCDDAAEAEDALRSLFAHPGGPTGDRPATAGRRRGAPRRARRRASSRSATAGTRSACRPPGTTSGSRR